MVAIVLVGETKVTAAASKKRNHEIQHQHDEEEAVVEEEEAVEEEVGVESEQSEQERVKDVLDKRSNKSEFDSCELYCFLSLYLSFISLSSPPSIRQTDNLKTSHQHRPCFRKRFYLLHFSLSQAHLSSLFNS